jgi:hypothetical protein
MSQLDTPSGAHSISRTTSRLLWVVQVLLAALFLFAGGFKLVTPAPKNVTFSSQ